MYDYSICVGHIDTYVVCVRCVCVNTYINKVSSTLSPLVYVRYFAWNDTKIEGPLAHTDPLLSYCLLLLHTSYISLDVPGYPMRYVCMSLRMYTALTCCTVVYVRRLSRVFYGAPDG
jgi:hypothetical protein